MKEVSVAKQLARFLGSMFITVLASQATMVVDAAVGGNLLGADAVSAVDLVMPVYELFYSLSMMLGMGACTVASVCLGRGDLHSVRKHFSAAVVSLITVMALMGLGILLFKDKFVRLLCGDSYLCGFTGDYLVAMVPYFIITSISLVFMMFTAMAGRPVLVMCCAIVQFAVNITCNLLLIEFAGLGIEALAYSSAIASALTLLLIWPYYLSNACPFRMVKCSFGELAAALCKNVRCGSGFIAVDVAYMLMAYSMNTLVLRSSGEDGLFFWSVVMMIYLTCDYASVAAQETSLSLGGRLLGAGDVTGVRLVYNRSLYFALGWMSIIIVGIFAMPTMALPLFGAPDETVYPVLLKTVASALPFIVGVSIGNLLLVRLVHRGKVLMYAVLSSSLFLAVPLVWLFKEYLSL